MLCVIQFTVRAPLVRWYEAGRVRPQGVLLCEFSVPWSHALSCGVMSRDLKIVNMGENANRDEIA